VIIDKEKKRNFLGNKRNTEKEKIEDILSKKNDSFLFENEDFTEKFNEDTKVLDLNMLYNSVSPPSELNEEIIGKIDLTQTMFHLQATIRK